MMPFNFGYLGSSKRHTAGVPAIPTLSSYAFRFEADDLTTLFQSNAGTTAVAANGDPVGEWADKSGIGFNVTSLANDTTRPTWNTSAGVSWVGFDGSNDGLKAATSPGLYAAGHATVSMALRGNPGTNAYLMVETNSASANATYAAMHSNATTATKADTFLRNDATTIVLSSVPVLIGAYGNTDNVITFVDTGSLILYFIDGVISVGLNYTRAGVVTLNNFGLGSYFRNATASNWWAGRVYNAIATKVAITRDQLRQLVKYQAYKQGGRIPTVPTPMFGTNSVYFVAGTYVDTGVAHFQYEKTQHWSCSVRFKTSVLPASASVIATNVTTGTAFPGIDFMYINSSGQVHVRLINSITSPSFVGVHGTTNIADGNAHTLLSTYDGSGTAAGVKLYVDGVLETMATESDTLGANTIFNSNQRTVVGNQLNHFDFAANGEMALFRLYSVTKDATFATTYANGQAPVGGADNCVLAYNFQEGVGTSTADLSPSGLNGTLASDLIWYI